MRTTPKSLIAGAAVIAILLLVIIFFITTHPSSPPITVRHIKSARTGNLITMTFEIRNHSADPYIFFPFEVQIRNGNAWTKFQGFDSTTIHPNPTIDPKGLASYAVNVTNLPAGSVVRFKIRPQKVLLGVNGLVRRAELELNRRKQGGGGGSMSLNPYDKNSKVFGLPSEIVSDEFVEPGPKR